MPSYLITGVSRGIGRTLSERLIAAGHQVFGLVRTVPTAESAAGPGSPGLGAAGLGLAGVLSADLSAPHSLESALAPWLARLTALDGVVHCAGVVRPGTLTGSRPVDFEEQFAVNVTAVAELTRLLLPALRAAAGAVVLVNSGSGLNARSPLTSYGASKHALRAYAEGLRQEEPGLRVSTLYPGRTATSMQRTVRAAEAGEYEESDYLQPATVAQVIELILALPADGVITDLTLRPSGVPGLASPDAPR
ncbi:MAG TPA: SDR family NAD(P)-dependent oxidoreductase [Jatrophihabitans sp.]|uniref:SDR family NAD(P)-dependent oxidoreductase n=1 Tax=Jatrophihabitans sp. TaxID=1932789 RepID=UPI002EF7C09E